MHTVLTILACAATGGVFGALFAHWTRPRPRRHRGEHRSWWQRGPRVDPYRSTDAPLKGLELTHDDAATQKIPLPRDGVNSLGEQ